MARYNSVNTTSSVAGGNTITTPYSGLLTTLTGSGTVIVPNPVYYLGSTQTYYNSTASAITLSTPGGVITGPGLGGGSTTLSLPAGSIITLVSDGTNYLTQDWLGGNISATTLSASAAVNLSPSALVTISPSAGLTINPTGSTGSIDNVVIGATTAKAGSFTTLSANSAVTFNAGANAAVSITNNYTFSGSNYHLRLIGDTTNYGYISQNPAQGGLVVADGMRYYGSGPWTPDATSAESIQLLGGNIIFTSNSGLTGGVNFSPTERIRITSSGQLLVGTTSTSDSARKILASGADVNAQKIDVANTTGLGSLIEVIAGGSTAYSIGGWDYSGIIEATGGGGTSALVLSAYNGPMIFQAGGRAERMRITSAGYVGVNTTNTNTATGNYTFNVNLRARFNGMMLGNNDGTNASDNRISLDWSSGSYSQILGQENVPLWLGQNNTQRVQVRSDGLLINSGSYYYVNELQLTSNQNTTVSSAGPKEIFRCSSSNLVTSGIFSIAATRGNYVTGSTYSWTSSHPIAGTITQLSSTSYTQHIVYIDIASDGSCIVSIDWTGYNASFPMSYQISVIKTAGSISFANAGTDWTTVATNYTRYFTYTGLANGFKANNGAFVGALSKGSGSFKIDHPLPALTDTNYLVHSFIEGPNADLIYRGEIELIDGIATVDIDQHSRMTEGTFEELCRKVQCFTTNETDWTAVRGRVVGNTLTIEAQDLKSTATVSWMVIGERKDKHMYETEWTNADGEVIVEPLKNPVQTEFPPYPENVNTAESTNGTL